MLDPTYLPYFFQDETGNTDIFSFGLSNKDLALHAVKFSHF